MSSDVFGLIIMICRINLLQHIATINFYGKLIILICSNRNELVFYVMQNMENINSYITYGVNLGARSLRVDNTSFTLIMDVVIFVTIMTTFNQITLPENSWVGRK